VFRPFGFRLNDRKMLLDNPLNGVEIGQKGADDPEPDHIRDCEPGSTTRAKPQYLFEIALERFYAVFERGVDPLCGNKPLKAMQYATGRGIVSCCLLPVFLLEFSSLRNPHAVILVQNPRHQVIIRPLMQPAHSKGASIPRIDTSACLKQTEYIQREGTIDK
jgi:hypothetical protein